MQVSEVFEKNHEKERNLICSVVILYCEDMSKLNKIFKKFTMIACSIFLLLLFFVDFSQSIHWLTLGKEGTQWHDKNKAGQCKIAGKNYGLTGRQVKICKTTFEAMPGITKAAEQTFEICQRLFEKRRWNCSTILTAPRFTPDLTTGTREQAFVYALSSASVAYSMSKACASGGLFNCSCSGHPKDPPNGNFKWGGCGDNIRWGIQFGKHFTDSAEKKSAEKKIIEQGQREGMSESSGTFANESSPKGKQWNKTRRKSFLAIVNLQNNRAGRKAVEMSLKTQCKCHGVSGSCSIKICWKALPKFIEIGERLQKKFGTSIEVIPRKFGYGRRLVPAGSNQYYYNGDDLVYITKSPDYCLRDEKTGSLGTRGRLCNRTSNDYDSCEIMCCGRGHVTLTIQKIEMCKCKFHWCCTVACKKCLHWVDTHICN